MSLQTKETIGWGVIVLLLILILFKGSDTVLNTGSVITGQEYNSTTTNAVVTGPAVLKTGSGSLASVIITKAGTGAFTIYNATTTDVNKRTGQKATSTIILAVFPASPTAQAYPFDSTFSDGLLVDYVNTMGTSTITWR